MKTVQTGDRLPQGILTIAGPDGPEPKDVSELLGKGRVVLFAVPGAFTPTCSARHLPGYVENAAQFREKGVDRVVCMAVNDIFVMEAWAKQGQVNDSVTMAADGNGDYTRALGLEMDASAFGMGKRSQRFALIANDGIVEAIMVESPGEFRVSSAEYVLEQL